jgi:hypothetical protein
VISTMPLRGTGTSMHRMPSGNLGGLIIRLRKLYTQFNQKNLKNKYNILSFRIILLQFKLSLY